VLALAALSAVLGQPAKTERVPGQEPAQATMKAVRVHGPGGTEVLRYEDVPRPVPKDTEVLVRVIAAGVNPVDAKVRAGGFGRRGEDAPPLILGWDVAGVVESAGARAIKFAKGDAVFAFLPLTSGGGYAEFVAIDESIGVAKPKSLSFAEAAGVPLAALTAWQALLDAGGLKAGQTVLIHGGSGGVGAFAVQIAKAKGARVLATASTANQGFLKSLGADVPIDYTTQKFEDLAKDAGGVDVVLDTQGGDTQKRSFEVLKKGGSLISIVGGPDQNLAGEKGVHARGILVKPDGTELAQIAGLVDAGKIKVTISQIVPLAEAARAHRQIETGHTRGKIVLKVAEDPGR
jgi:NADPH:quinone reductase-like Zn-dependent oxidoreductase